MPCCLGNSGSKTSSTNQVLALDEGEDALANRLELLTWSNTVDRRRLHTGGDLVLKTDDAHLEELIDHVGEDRDELAAVEDRQHVVISEVEESRAELSRRDSSRLENRSGPKDWTSMTSAPDSSASMRSIGPSYDQ